MDEMTTEELAQWLEWFSAQRSGITAERITQAAARLRATDAELAVLTYAQAKEAVRLFESEYIGQDQADLWAWAIDEARKG